MTGTDSNWPLLRYRQCAGGLVVGLLLILAGGEARGVDFEQDVRPILSSRCLKCHGAAEPKGELDLSRREAAVEHGAIVPDRPEESELLSRVASADPETRMPPEGPALTAQEVETLRVWIAEGAPWPRHWSLRNLTEPPLPNIKSPDLQAWCETPLDDFIAARLEAAGLTPSPQADRRTLLRRASFLVRGLPPTPAEMQEFLADERPTAWEECVDRLLASPAYGERWARHWMDLVHFAETHGHDQDRPREHAWPYRDYLIHSFNADVPYAQFVAEQIAGDVLDPSNPWAIRATGFLAAGPWDESSLRDIREDTLDREIARMLDRDDIVTTVMSTFTSTSVQCARCHDHKFDPISQTDYYGLQAVFSGIDKANRAYDPDPATTLARTNLQAEQAELETLITSNPEALLQEPYLNRLAAWEQQQSDEQVLWRRIQASSAVSLGGCTLTQQPDGSWLAEGSRPDKDVYVLHAELPLHKLTALRLDVLADERLPMSGPGRQDNGNLHLNEVRVWQVLDDAGTERELSFQNVVADFDQAGWGITAAFDKNPNTAWGIHPAVGQSHLALFPLTQPLEQTAPIRLRIELAQLHGGGHNIGRFQVSGTEAPPDQLSVKQTIPVAVSDTLAISVEQRTPGQQRELLIWFLRQDVSQRLAALPLQEMVYCGTSQFTADGSFKPAMGPRPVHVLHRGLVQEPRELVSPCGLHCVQQLTAEFTFNETDSEGARRVALARWLTDPQHPLTWRSIANRIWQAYFGRGLVSTPNDFGQMGAAPTHPELLDWLAVTLQTEGGSLKKLQRLILLSATFQQVAADRPEARLIDADNQLLWRMPRQRLDAESFRDALLVAAGNLDPTMGGPSVRQFLQSPGVHVTPVVDYQSFRPDAPAHRRRSVYRFLFRTIPDPFMEALDCPDASQLSPTRNVSLTALQALATWNDKFLVHQCEVLASQLEQESTDLAQQIDLACWRLLSRGATPEEQQLIGAYATEHGLANACRVLCNTNEFLFVE